MKKVILMMVMCATALSLQAQKFALVDMDYIFKNIPAYERANEQLNQVSKKWQAEVDALQIEAQTLYKNYQNEVVFLSQEQKKTRQDAIMEKEKEAADLKKKYFGPQGELFKKRTALMSPIQEHVSPCSASEKGKWRNTPPSPHLCHTCPSSRLLAWKGLVNYVKGQEPKITPCASQENTPLPRPCPHPTSSDTPIA